MPNVPLTTDDLFQHIIKIGIDIHPSIELDVEGTRLSIFFEEAKNACPHLVDRIISSDTEFVLSKTFSVKQGAAKMSVPTFAMTGRGPVFIFPILLPPPGGDTGLEASWEEDFTKMRQLFAHAIPGRDYIRCGLVRELLFNTADDRCSDCISTLDAFAGADLVGGNSRRVYKDGQYNNNITITTVEIASKKQLAAGPTVREDVGFGLKIDLDVNNIDLRTLNEDDVNDIIERANSLWPDTLLEYIEAASKKQ
ncbi:MAG: hypothetical protein IH984_08910 [Planctomycetes bacterium]|nr:hypothetical protein [Planctomycetota bacterium]